MWTAPYLFDIKFVFARGWNVGSFPRFYLQFALLWSSSPLSILNCTNHKKLGKKYTSSGLKWCAYALVATLNWVGKQWAASFILPKFGWAMSNRHLRPCISHQNLDTYPHICSAQKYAIVLALNLRINMALKILISSSFQKTIYIYFFPFCIFSLWSCHSLWKWEKST